MDDAFHDFPTLMDEDILSSQILKRADGRTEYAIRGVIDGKEGVFHITTKGDQIIHRTFVPSNRWDSFATNHGLPNIDLIP